MTLVLVCGFRRTGKDTFYESLTSNSSTKRDWRSYKHPEEKRALPRIRYRKESFAALLKREASEIYSIPTEAPDDKKDLKIFINRGAPVSARDIYIEWGAVRRGQNINYWCERINIRGDLVITDWRFPNELEYLSGVHDNIITVRVYRSAVPEPNIEEESEHSLDNHNTNFLAFPEETHEEEFSKAVKRFPQYRDYIPSEVI